MIRKRREVKSIKGQKKSDEGFSGAAICKLQTHWTETLEANCLKLEQSILLQFSNLLWRTTSENSSWNVVLISAIAAPVN